MLLHFHFFLHNDYLFVPISIEDIFQESNIYNDASQSDAEPNSHKSHSSSEGEVPWGWQPESIERKQIDPHSKVLFIDTS